MDQQVPVPPAEAGPVNAPLAQSGNINVPDRNVDERVDVPGGDGREGAVNVPMADGNGVGQGRGGNINLPPVGG